MVNELHVSVNVNEITQALTMRCNTSWLDVTQGNNNVQILIFDRPPEYSGAGLVVFAFD